MTLVGMHYYDEENFVFKANQIRLSGANPRLYLRRNPSFEFGIDVIFEFENGFEKVGSIATNQQLVLEDTINGRLVSKVMEPNSIYPCHFRMKELLHEQGYGGRIELDLTPARINTNAEAVKIVVGIKKGIGITSSGVRNLNEIINRLEGIERASESNKARLGDATVRIADQNGAVVSAYTISAKDLENTVATISATGHTGGHIDTNILLNRQHIYQSTGTPIKEKKGNLMKNMNSMFTKFGKDFAFNTSNFALSMFGGLAVKVNGSFVSYNVEKGEAMDVMDFVIDGFEDFIMIMPVQELSDGDIFIQDGKVYQMIDKEKKSAYNYTDNSIDTLVTKANIMGFKMYAKVMNFASGMMNMAGGETKDGNMFANPVFMMMMMKDGDGDMGEMMKLMMMSQMFQGGFNLK